MRIGVRTGTVFSVLAVVAMLAGCPPQAGAPPIASFTADVTSGAAPLVVQFTDTSTPGDATITAWAWDFGDGGTSANQNPAHTYTANGTYTVSLVVTTRLGSGTATRDNYITVTDVVGTDPPVAAFSAAPISGEAPLAVTFTDTSTPGSAPITQWDWNFGDGASGTTQNPAHSYANPGTYTVSLTVRTALGTSTETKSNFIDVDEPISQFTVRISEFMADNETTLQDEDGLFSDWIEIHNYGDDPVDLENWTLTDTLLEADKWSFPAITLAPGAYLIVFASDFDRRPTDGTNLHCGFRLSSDGESLALFAPGFTTPVSAYTPTYPVQSGDISYGYLGGLELYFDTATPGTANIGGELAPPDPPAFSMTRGHYDTPFDLALSTTSSGISIRYTLDGTDPTPENGLDYSAPLRLTTNTILRAAAFRDSDAMASSVTTHTYIIGAGTAERALPALCIAASPTQSLYEPNGVMAIVGGTYVPDDDGILAWTPDGPEDYNNPIQRGSEFERPISFEFVEGLDGFQMDCGLRIHGGGDQRARYRRSEDWSNQYEKFSFRFYFTDDYQGELEDQVLFAGDGPARHETLILRGGDKDQFNPFLRERLLREAAWSMGQPTARGRFVSLYINAEYKGYFELVERYDETYFRENFAVDSQWDIVDDDGAQEGSSLDWDGIVSFAGSNDLSGTANYSHVTSRLDVDAFIDHCIVQLYSANPEWVDGNWLAAREGILGAKFQMYVADGEDTWNPLLINADGFINFPLGDPADETGLNQADTQIAHLFRGLYTNAGFRARFNQRVALHFSPGGGLSKPNLTALFDALHAELIDVIPGLTTYIRDFWIPQREATVLQQFQDQGLYTP